MFYNIIRQAKMEAVFSDFWSTTGKF